MERLHLRWFLRYLRYLAKICTTYPRDVFRLVPRSMVYLFVPWLTRAPKQPDIYSCADPERAAEAFHRDGYVVLRDALTADEASELRRIVEPHGERVVEQERTGVLTTRYESREPERYSFADHGPCREWEYLSRDERILNVLRRIWAGQSFGAVAAGGDFVRPGGGWQVLHSDMLWDNTGDAVPDVITVNYYVSEVRPEHGPVRQVPGTGRFPLPNKIVQRFEPKWMKRTLVTGSPGYAMVRDPRAWHGGTPNTSNEVRHMPNIVYVRHDAPLDDISVSLNAQDLGQGRWIAEFANA
jgi:ectoine hydroxylase-related dioxygenase (phytanoyl-CoA dioxygenase family)